MPRSRMLPLLVLLTTVAPAQTPTALPSDADLDRMILGLEPLGKDGAPTSAKNASWFTEGKIGASTGFRNNVLFAPQATIDSAYARIDADWSAFVLPVSGRWSAFAAVQAEWETFLSRRDQLPDQAFGVALLGGDWRPHDQWKTGLLAQAAYSDQYFGVAVSDTLNQTVGVAATQWLATPEVQWKPTGPWRLAITAPVEWDRFDTATENYDQAGGALSVGWFKPSYDVSLASGYHARAYDAREVRTEFGFAVVDSHLRWRILENKLTAHLTAGREKEWKFTARLAHRQVSDGKFGYDDNRRYDASAGATFERGPWRADASVWLAWVRYDVQGIALLDRTLRAYATVAAEVTATRSLSARWRLTGAARWENLDSNRPGDDYTVQSVRVGLAWTFETFR